VAVSNRFVITSWSTPLEKFETLDSLRWQTH